jgi:hypothetical protein
MKKLRIVSAGLVVFLFLGLTSCYWVFNSGMGSLQLDLSGLLTKGPGIRSARVYLIANNQLYPLGADVDYVQVEYNQVTEITLEDIPVGPTYRVAVSLGYAEPGWFDTSYWAESAAFEIFPGAKAAVVFSADDFYFSEESFHPIVDSSDGDPTMMDKSLKDVEVFNSNAYSTDGGKLYKLPNFNPSALTLLEKNAPAGQSIKSLSVAVSDGAFDALCANTADGFYSYNDISDNFDSTPTTVSLGSYSVLDSRTGSYSYSKLIVFGGNDRWGGTVAGVESSASNWKWANQSSSRVTDVVVSKDTIADAYFATTGGAFRVKGDYLYEISIGGSPNVNSYKTGFSVPSPIISLELVDFPVAGPVVTLLMGTENGVWEAPLAAEPDVINQPTRRDGTQGFRIRQIAASNYTNPYFIAYLSDAYLFVWSDPDKELFRFPIAAGLPGRITSMAWFDPGGGMYYLLVSGDEGLVFRAFYYPV